MPNWKPDQYLKFAAEQGCPVAILRPASPSRIGRMIDQAARPGNQKKVQAILDNIDRLVD